MTTWFTADTHFGHARVIDLNGRPFADANTMDEAMIAAWNARVQPDDTVWHLGDFALGRDEKIVATFRRLAGIKQSSSEITTKNARPFSPCPGPPSARSRPPSSKANGSLCAITR